MKSLVALSICASLCACVSSSLAPFITPCYSWDDACLLRSTQAALPYIAAGVPSLGMRSVDPMTIERVVANQAGLQMDFRDTVVKGLRNCAVLNLKRYTQRTRLDLMCSVTVIGNYKLGGSLLVLPIEGQGKYKIKIRDIVVKIDFNWSERLVNGQKYWSLDTWRHTAEVQTKAEFLFQNLFNGNRQLSDTIHEFANSNWRDIFQEVSPPIVNVIVSNIVEEIRKLFNIVPVSDLSLD